MTTELPVLELLGRLIAYPTVSHRPVDAIAAELAERAETAGFRVTRYETSPGKANVVARTGPVGTDGIVLSGHMDVVPVDGQDWSSDPFELTRRDDEVYGRGTADMKGFIAAATTAMTQIDPSRLTREVVLVWTHDEEIGCRGSRALVDDWADAIAPLPSHTWIGEPTGLRICRMHPGHSTIEIHCTGRSAHSSRPSLGLNAIHLAQRVLATLEGLAAEWTRHEQYADHLPSPFTVMNVGRIEGGSAVNIVPEHCVLTLGIRPLPGQDGEVLVSEIQHALEPVQQHARFQGGDVSTSVVQHAPALFTPADTELEELLRAHAISPESTGAPFATDGGNLQELGTQCLVFGPGSIDVAHKPNEHIAIADLVHTVEIVRSVVHTRCIEPDALA